MVYHNQAYRVLLMVGLGLIVCIHVRAQSPYTIAVQAQDDSIQSGFLHMGTNRSPDGTVLSYNSRYLTKNGRPWYPVMGEMHFSRVAANDWESSILKMKAAGIQVIATYVFWNHHESTEGTFDWSGNLNLKAFLQLCKKHNMYVWLRPGPWVHAEARYGGFPDWLMDKRIGLRKNDTAYLRLTQIFFKEIARQCQGAWFKQNGAIIGVQVENELVFKKEEIYAHMITLKRLVQNAGMDVPYYSAFAQGPDSQVDFLYMMGSYPDSPWSQTIKKLVKPIYFIKPLEADRDIGSDLFGKVDGKVRNSFPKLSAEIGGGMQVTYHRRVVVSAKDLGANVFTKIASGLNGIGYYMFHGGVNPTAATGLQESRATQYPNDVPVMNYDFEAPVGAMGIISNSYHELRLQHLFLQDYGAMLASLPPFFPEVRKMAAGSSDTVQACVRANKAGGFIFLSNYQRHVPQPAVPGFQLQLRTAKGRETIPAQPVLFAADSYAIWPWHLQLNKAELVYATAQPLCILKNNDTDTYVFFAEEAAAFVFNPASIQGIEMKANGKLEKATVNCSKDQITFFTVTDKTNHTVEIIVLPREKALQAYKINIAGNETLLLSDASTVYASEEQLQVEDQQGKGAIQLLAWPALKLKAAMPGIRLAKQAAPLPFTGYTLSPETPATAAVTYHAAESIADTAAARRYRDSILATYAKGKSFKPTQQGPLYQLQWHHLPGEKLYQVKAAIPASKPLVKEWIAAVNYQGDVMAWYQNNRLVYDDFNKDGSCQWRLNADAIKGIPFSIQILPPPAPAEIYVEDAYNTSKNNSWYQPAITRLQLTPVYHYRLSIQ